MNSRVIRVETTHSIKYLQGQVVIKEIRKNGSIDYSPDTDRDRIQRVRGGRPDLISWSGWRYWTCLGAFRTKGPRS